MHDDSLSGWEFVCSTSELLPGERKTIWHGDTAILVVNLDGAFYALEDRCSHEDFELSIGEIDCEAGQIECILHGAKFDLRTGQAMCAPAYTPVATFPVKVVDGAIWTRDDRD